MNSNGTNPVNLTNNAASDGAPAFNSDGTRIYLVSDRDGGDDDIYSMNTAGGDTQRLTFSGGFDVWRAPPAVATP